MEISAKIRIVIPNPPTYAASRPSACRRSVVITVSPRVPPRTNRGPALHGIRATVARSSSRQTHLTPCCFLIPLMLACASLKV